jgi:hypothetical protein
VHYLGSAFKSASFRAHKDIFEVQFDIIVYSRHLSAGIMSGRVHFRMLIGCQNSASRVVPSKLESSKVLLFHENLFYMSNSENNKTLKFYFALVFILFIIILK